MINPSLKRKAEVLAEEVNYIVANKRYLKKTDSSRKLPYFISSIFMKKLIENDVKNLEEVKTTYSGAVLRIYLDKTLKELFKPYFLSSACSDEELSDYYSEIRKKIYWAKERINFSAISNNLFFIYEQEPILLILGRILNTSNFSEAKRNCIINLIMFLLEEERSYEPPKRYFPTKKNIYYQIKISEIIGNEINQIQKVKTFFINRANFIKSYNLLTPEEKSTIINSLVELNWIFQQLFQSNSIEIISEIVSRFNYEELIKLTSTTMFLTGSYNPYSNHYIQKYILGLINKDNLNIIDTASSGIYDNCMNILEDKTKIIVEETIYTIPFILSEINENVKDTSINFMDALIASPDVCEEIEKRRIILKTPVVLKPEEAEQESEVPVVLLPRTTYYATTTTTTETVILRPRTSSSSS